MKAELLPLKGKYYGTRIDITDGETRIGPIDLWFSDYTPSDRELEVYGVTREQWDNNSVEIDDGWGGKCKVRDADLFPDSHHETVKTLEVARIIVDAINGASK